MSDVGLGATLELTITDALRRVDQLGRAIDEAVSGVPVTIDTSTVAPEITRAVDAADTEATVTADALEVTTSIDGAVDAADTAVVVTGDATELTGDVTAAIDAADTNVAVTGSIDPGLAQGAEALGDSLDAAATSGVGLKGILAGLGAAAVAKGLFEAAQAASDLAESTSKATVVFGTGIDEVQTFAVEAAQAIGLSEQAALEAAGTFGNLFQALGVSQQAAAELSPQILTLAADLASFNNLGTDEVLEKLRSGLVGEIEPLRSMGISFNAAQVEAKAFELGLAAVGGEVSEGAKLQARYALITEQTTLAQGDFARTSDGLANQQRILNAEWDNAVAAIGQALLPALLALVEATSGAIPGIQELATAALPALASILTDLAPLIGTSVDLLVLLAPIFEAIAFAVDLIPGPLIAFGGAMLIASKAIGAFGGAARLAQGLVGGLGKSLTGINPVALVAVTAVAAVVTSFQAASANAAEVEAQIGSLASSFSELGTSFETGREAIRSWLDTLAESDEQVQFTGLVDLLDVTVQDITQRLGLGTAEMARLIARGPEAIDEFLVSLGPLDDEAKTAAVGLVQLAEGAGEAAKTTLLAKAATDDLTGAQQRELDALIAAGAPTEDYVRLLDDVSESQAAAAAEAERTIAKYGPLADAYINTAVAAESLRKSQPLLAVGLESVQTSAGGGEDAMLNLALAMGDAELSEQDLADAAVVLGTDVATLTGIIEEAGATLDEFVSTATGALPTLADAFKLNVGQGAVLEIDEFIANLESSAQEMEDFTFRLAVLTQAGFSELAGVIAQQGPEVGGALVSELVTALSEGHVEIVEEAEKATQDFNTQWENTASFFRDVLGPEFILQAGLLGTGLTEAFGAGLTFQERMRIAAELAANELDTQGDAIAAIAATEGAQAARDYGAALGLDQETIDAAVAAGLAIKNTPTRPWREGGNRVGGAFGDGIIDGMVQKQDEINTKAAQIALAAAHAAAGPSGLDAGSPSRVTARLLGVPFVEGFIVGMEDAGAQAVAEAERIVRAAAGVAAVSPAVTAAAAGVGAGSAAGAGGSSFEFNVTVNPPEGMTQSEASAVGAGIVDGAARALEARRIAVLGRVQ